MTVLIPIYSSHAVPGLSHAPPGSTWGAGLPQALCTQSQLLEASGPPWGELHGEVRTSGAFREVADTVRTEGSGGSWVCSPTGQALGTSGEGWLLWRVGSEPPPPPAGHHFLEGLRQTCPWTGLGAFEDGALSLCLALDDMPAHL